MNSVILNQPIGVIFTNIDSPNVNEYHFILNEATPYPIRHSMYCYSISEEGMLVGRIEKISVKNEYYEKPQTVKKLKSVSSYGLQNYFPSDRWEDYLGNVKVLGVFPFDGDSIRHSHEQKFQKSIKRAAFPAKPGSEVFLLEDSRLFNFLGFEKDGLNLGRLENYDMDVKLGLNRLINKHFAVLAMSGAGKSYLISIIIEELLRRKQNLGTPGIILIDVHGEYKFLSDNSITENKDISLKTKYYDSKYFQIKTSSLSAYDIVNFQPSFSKAQIRELNKIIDKLRKRDKKEEDKSYNLNDIITEVEQSSEINQKVREALIGWLFDLNRTNLFYSQENPQIKNLVKPGTLSIIDLSNIISLKKKQIIVAHLIDKLFLMRRREKIPPFLLILEEAHQFAPEGGAISSVSKRIIETIAREGRKFFAQICLISQRPVKLSTTALSQCNTHIILRVTNPNDLDHIKASSEALTKDNLNSISTLPTGNALIMGNATNFPIFVGIRERMSQDPNKNENLDSVCKNFI